MKARILKYGNWWYSRGIYIESYIGWKTVTLNCYTYSGAKLALKIRIKQNIPKELKI